MNASGSRFARLAARYSFSDIAAGLRAARLFGDFFDMTRFPSDGWRVNHRP